jgi:Acetoacetate decarboxylase (ADC)
MYEFEPGKRYRMPTHFGPSLGPRQGPGERRYQNRVSPRTTALSVSFESDPDALAALMPPGFSVAESARVTIRATTMTEIEWLAGRGYNTLGLFVDAEFHGVDRVSGEFLTVLWENSADAIVTGREELGFNKVYAELDDLSWNVEETTIDANAGWDGYEFLRMHGSDLEPTEPPSTDPPPILHYKYVPATGRRGEADASYPTISPRDISDSQVIDAHTGKGSVEWSPGTWEQLPTLEPIVSRLADLPVLDEPSASVVRTVGSQDLGDTRRLSRS